MLPLRGTLTSWRNGLVGDFVEPDTGKCKLLPLGRSSPVHLDRLGTLCLQSSSAEKEVSKLTGSQQRALVAKVADSLLGCIASRLREVMAPLCPALVQEKHGQTGASPAKDRKDG